MFIQESGEQQRTWNAWAEYAGDQSHLGDFPDGWEAALSPSGKVYFVNHNLKTTTWIDPRTKNLRYPTVLECQPGDLPYGWEELNINPAGCKSTQLTVFANHTKRKLTLHDPTRTNARQMQYLDKRNLTLIDDPTAAGVLKHQIKTYWMDQVRAIEEEYRRGMRNDADELEEGEIVVASPTASSRSRGTERSVFEQRQASRAIGVQTVAGEHQVGTHYVTGRVSPQRQIHHVQQQQALASRDSSPVRGRHTTKGSRSRPSSPQRFAPPMHLHSDDKIGRVKTAGV
ncbi:hypothetical protein BCR44DRAFT_34085 [Catenaria anguillulae PL171]|uniref:WW domain-containing protein n=1 Tax=Catenaria anguillulae PL171 TaxID=765915 RepID=A0A1Y2HUL2_9FUNG|nr:hypothetical protein BCR44DRAFT_34085 [Catenaria anguillulae PL171]